MQRNVEEADTAFIKAANASLIRRTGLGLTPVFGDLIRSLDGMRPLAWARTNGFDPDQFVEEVTRRLHMSPVEEFPSAKVAEMVNFRRAALVNFGCDNPEWKMGAGIHAGTLLREGDDGQVIRMAIGPSRDGGQYGFEMSVAEDASLVQGPGTTVSVSPADAEFLQVSSAYDIVDALAKYEVALDQHVSHAPKA